MNKEIDQKVEEQTQNWLQYKERKVWDEIFYNIVYVSNYGLRIAT
jgi:hypothetical protein